MLSLDWPLILAKPDHGGAGDDVVGGLAWIAARGIGPGD